MKYNERPQLGQVLEVKENKVSIKWYDGTWSGKWKVYTYMDGRNSVAWVETLPVSDIIIGKIELTKLSHCQRQLRTNSETCTTH